MDTEQKYEDVSIDDDDDILGLDEDENENIIYLESNDGIIITVLEDYLGKIDLVKTIMISDGDAGRSENNTIILTRVNGKILLLLKDYLEYHKTNDYVVNYKNSEHYADRLMLWDRNFINRIVSSDDDDLFDKFLECANYLLFDTLTSKLCCYLAQSEQAQDYKDLFSMIHYQKK